MRDTIDALDVEKAREQLIEELRESEARFRLLFENAPLGYQSLDENGHFIEVNQAWLDTLGYVREEVIGKSFADFLHPDWKDHFKINFPRFKAVGEVLGVEFEMVRKDGSYILVSFNGKIGKDESGRFKQTHCILHDITDRMQAKAALASVHLQLQSIINNMPAIVYAFDLEERFIMANAALAELFQTNPEQILGKRRHAFMPKTDADWHEANDRKVIEAGQALEFEEYSELPDRSITWLTTKFPLRDAQGRIYAVAGISKDISERKEVEENLRQTKEMARQRLAELEDLYRNAPVGLCVLDRDLRFVRINDLLAEINGIPAEAHIGKCVHDLLPELAETVEPEMRRVLETGQPRHNIEIVSETPARPGVKRSWLEPAILAEPQ